MSSRKGAVLTCRNETTVQVPSEPHELNWVQTYVTDSKDDCTPGTPVKDPCQTASATNPLYRPGKANDLFKEATTNSASKAWNAVFGVHTYLFRDIPNRTLSDLRPGYAANGGYLKETFSELLENFGSKQALGYWRTAPDPHPKGGTDNHLRLVAVPQGQKDKNYEALEEVRYGFRIESAWSEFYLVVDPLVIGGRTVDQGGVENYRALIQDYKNGKLPRACTSKDPSVLLPPDGDLRQFEYRRRTVE